MLELFENNVRRSYFPSTAAKTLTPLGQSNPQIDLGDPAEPPTYARGELVFGLSAQEIVTSSV